MTEMNQIKKESFSLESVLLECGEKIPVTLGYETYGKLNSNKDNVILIAHYFSASSHAAGKYSEKEVVAGYWDSLIGPGKAIDTNRFFVVSTDNLCNVQWKNPFVITTGPQSINPQTGKKWGSEFPTFTFRDMAHIQKRFLKEHLGIEKLYAVAGPSAGGFIALEWAIQYPDLVERVVGVITNPQTPSQTAFTVCQHAMRAIQLDSNWCGGDYSEDNEPVEGLRLAVQMMNAGAFTAEFYEEIYGRQPEKENFIDPNIQTSLEFERKLGDAVADSSRMVDASHWYYTCKATLLHDVSRGFTSLREALEKIQAKVLLVSCLQDQLQPTKWNREMVEILKEQGKKADLVCIESTKGHMAGVLDGKLFEERIRQFLVD